MAGEMPNTLEDSHSTTIRDFENHPPSSLTISSQEDGNILIKIKTLNNLTFDLHVLPDIPISELKVQVRNSTDVPEDRQRLIYRGKVLKDGDALSHYQVENGHTLHMVARPGVDPVGNPSTISSTASTTTTTTTTSATTNETASLSRTNQSRVDDWLASMASRTASVEALRSSVEALRNRRAAAETTSSNNNNNANANVNSSASTTRNNDSGTYGGSLEHIRQGIQSIQTILATTTTTTTHSNTDFQEEEKEDINGNQPRFFVGQWLDVKDTVNQWLEATVFGISRTQILVHYNGWPSRWDEWINMDSNRISPFRTRTYNSARSSYASPTPATWVRDVPNTPPLELQDDIRSVIVQARNALHSVLPLLDTFADTCITAQNTTTTTSTTTNTTPNNKDNNNEDNNNEDTISSTTTTTPVDEELNTRNRRVESSSYNVDNPDNADHHTVEELSVDSDLNLELTDLDVVETNEIVTTRILNSESTLLGNVPTTNEQLHRTVSSSEIPSTASASFSSSQISPHTEHMIQQAANIAPLLDRLGRIFLDLAPQVHGLGANTCQFLPGSSSINSSTVETLPQQRTDSGYRDMILTASQPPSPPRSQGNIDIHIHAIVTPLRIPVSTGSSLNESTTSVASASAAAAAVAALNPDVSIGSATIPSVSSPGPETPLLSSSARTYTTSDETEPSETSLNSGHLTTNLFPSTPEISSPISSNSADDASGNSNGQGRSVGALSSILSAVRRTLQQYNERLNSAITQTSNEEDANEVIEEIESDDDEFSSSFANGNNSTE